MDSELYGIIDRDILEHSEELITQGKELSKIPEFGFCELKTSAYMKSKLQRLGISPIRETAVTGFIATLPGRAHNARIAIIAELDGIYSPKNSTADPKTGASHACGHNIQTNALLGVAAALSRTKIMNNLDGDVVLMGVPAEENTPTDILEHLQKKGKIEKGCGKHEMLRLGDFEGIDIVLGNHALEDYPQEKNLVMVNTSCHGLKVLRFTYHGKAAHSTVCPEKGINALNAAIMAINGIEMLRETFDTEESTRVSYNITEGGHNIGSVVDLAILEVVVATKSMHELDALTGKITDIAKQASCMIGCTIDTTEIMQYKPYSVDPNLLSVIQRDAEVLTGRAVSPRPHNYFSNDLGDISQIIPTAQVVYGGFYGDLHSAEFSVVDDAGAYVLPARVMARTIVSLLSDGARETIKIREEFCV